MMTLEVLRGLNQIGGNLIQVTCGGTKILLDAGESLELPRPGSAAQKGGAAE